MTRDPRRTSVCGTFYGILIFKWARTLKWLEPVKHSVSEQRNVKVLYMLSQEFYLQDAAGLVPGQPLDLM